MSLDEIKKNLSPSDAKLIAKHLGYTPEMVRLVLNGLRNNNTIIEVAKVVAENNKSLEEQISAMAGE